MNSNTKNLALMWMLAITRYVVKTGISVVAILQAMTVAWSAMNPFERQSLELSIWLVFLSHTESFVNNIIKGLKDGNELPPDESNGNGGTNGGTAFLTKAALSSDAPAPSTAVKTIH